MEQSKDASTIITEKDNEISRLKLVLHAHITRTSVTQGRLLATQDALDAFNASHAQELNNTLSAKNNLKRKLRVYHDFVKNAEKERDDLRDAVVSLVEKVDACNHYTLWPHSRIHISALLDPIDSFPPHLKREPGAKSNSDDDLLAYAAAMIESLTVERDVERQAHERTRRIANERISALEAQLALREAELETCVAHTAECFRVDKSDLKAKPMDQEVAIRILELASAKRRTIQTQNEYLMKRLEAARQKTFLHPEYTQDKVDAPGADEVAAVPKGRLEGRLDETDDTIRATRTGAGTNEPLDSAPPSLIDEMDQEIQELGRKIQSFKLERVKLLDIIADENVKPNNVVEQTQLPHHDEAEDSPLRHARFSQDETDYVVELEKAYQSALQREKILIEENTQLRTLRIPDTPQRNESVNTNVPEASLLLDAEDSGELTMELATPLLPTSLVLSAVSPARSLGSGGAQLDIGDALDVDLEARSIPLPPSPPSPNIQLQPSSTAVLSVGAVFERRATEDPQGGLLDVDLQQLDMDLVNAQQQLDEGQKALDDIEYVLDHVQRDEF